MNHPIETRYRYGLCYDLNGQIVGFNLSPNVFIGLTDEEIEMVLEAYAKRKHEQDECLHTVGEIAKSINQIIGKTDEQNKDGDRMSGVCDTCKHSWGEENCNGCLWDGESQRNTHWEPKEPFINKPCVSEQACREDKVKVLEKIKTEIEAKCCITVGRECDGAITLHDVFEIINKYMTESEDKE